MAQAGNRISMDYDAMAEASTKLMTQKEEFDTCIKELTNIINGLTDIWEGQTAQSYQEQFTDLLPSFNQASELVETLSSQMNSIVQNTQDTDSTMAGQLGVGK